MKINQILSEAEAAAGTTSVASIGKVEYQSWPGLIKLYKRDDTNVPKCIAKFGRQKGQGWKMKVTEEWEKMGLPHFGHVQDIRLPINGKKTISNNLERLFKVWGIRVETFSSLQKEETQENPKIE